MNASTKGSQGRLSNLYFFCLDVKDIIDGIFTLCILIPAWFIQECRRSYFQPSTRGAGQQQRPASRRWINTSKASRRAAYAKYTGEDADDLPAYIDEDGECD